MVEGTHNLVQSSSTNTDSSCNYGVTLTSYVDLSLHLFHVCIHIADAIPLTYAEFQLSVFGELANNSILFDEVQCRGDENSLIECQHEGIGSHECFSFAAGVICTGNLISLCCVSDVWQCKSFSLFIT